MTSLYIHIPFCLRKCGYCSFNSYAGMEELFPRYVAALTRELATQAATWHGGQLDTIFFGGGTPSLLSGALFDQILVCCNECFGIAQGAEISIEANPKTVDFMKLLHFRQAGINRLSFGVQSFIDSELELLGRLHSAQDGWNCVRDGLAAGFGNINIDLMYGLPGQNLQMWKWNLENALALDITHLSLYQLTLEEGTELHCRYQEGLVHLPDEEVIEQMDELTLELTNQAEFAQYEISNYARHDLRCRHNQVYWHNYEYLAAGAGAVSYLNRVRARNISHPVAYCEAVEQGKNLIEEQEQLTEEAAFRESVVVGLRMVDGISFSELYHRYGLETRTYYGQLLVDLVHGGFLEMTSSHLRLTPRGRQIANQVLNKLV